MTTVDPLEQQREIDHLRSEVEKLRRMAMIGELASTTTHEFNNLMMTILNFAKMGQRNQETAARDKAFDRILKASEKATKVTGTVLAMSRGRSASKEPVALKSLIEDTVVLLEREYRKYRVHLELNLQETATVDGMADELQRLIVNLLVNARQATPEGGQVRVSLVQEDGLVRLSVRDNGSGIAPDVLPRIFDPFFSTKAGPDESGKGGTGVGLASCKEIIEAHEGRIRVESSVGKGTDFIIRLPVSQQPVQNAKAG
ncbi:MAG: sensor histidine kinase [Pirellulaceae bacterium]